MATRSLAVRRLAFVLFAGIFCSAALWSQAGTDRARIALFALAGQKADAALSAALDTVADSVELSLVCLERYDVRRVPAADPAREMGRVKSYCQANRIDQAILGSGSARKDGGYAFRLVVYDRRTDAITVDQQGTSRGALDMFDTTDALVVSLLDGLSGTHLLFGSLIVESDPAGALISVNGKDVGAAPVTLRGLPTGVVKVAGRGPGLEQAETSATIVDGGTASAKLTLARSVGTLSLVMPDDATLILRGNGMTEKTLLGINQEELPTGTYQAEAQCPGLQTVRMPVTIQRNETSTVLPWAKGYIEVDAEPAGSLVVVDGKERGASPLVVEVEPAGLHVLELKQAKYLPYRADLSARAGRKVSFSPAMTPTPGSVRVETNPPGAEVRLDDGRAGKTPFIFEGVAPGSHKVTIFNLLSFRRYYTCGHLYTVTVSSDERATLFQNLVQATGGLRITGALVGSTVSVDGSLLDAAAAFGGGADVPAGELAVVVTSPAGQSWSKDVRIQPGSNIWLKTQEMEAALPRRAVKVDGNVDDWEGLAPLWQDTSVLKVFPNQPGTQLTSFSLCRDEKNLYVRGEFADGKPTFNLTKDFKQRLDYQFRVWLPRNDLLTVDISYDRNWGAWAGAGIYNTVTKSYTKLGERLPYAFGESSIEIEIPLSLVEKRLVERPSETDFSVASATDEGWLQHADSGRALVNYAK